MNMNYRFYADELTQLSNDIESYEIPLMRFALQYSFLSNHSRERLKYPLLKKRGSN